MFLQIKTTSPDKYRVRPSAGVINAGAALNITVHIQSGYSASQLVRDKFLVMACAIDSDTLTNQQLIEVWKVSHSSASGPVSGILWGFFIQDRLRFRVVGNYVLFVFPSSFIAPVYGDSLESFKASSECPWIYWDFQGL